MYQEQLMFPPEPNPIVALSSAVIDCAMQRSYSVNLNPEELSKTRTKSVSFQKSNTEHTSASTQLRAEMAKVPAPVGLFVKSHSSYAIQIGRLGGELLTGVWEEEYYGELISQWHGYQQYAAIARTWLLSDYSDDLNLFLVGPVGSKDETEWQNFAQVIERNDLVCRKLVWLPGKNDHEWSIEMGEFLDRTFLAQPWKMSEVALGISLDALSSTMKDFVAWREVLERPEFRSELLDHGALVAALLEAI